MLFGKKEKNMFSKETFKSQTQKNNNFSQEETPTIWHFLGIRGKMTQKAMELVLDVQISNRYARHSTPPVNSSNPAPKVLMQGRRPAWGLAPGRGQQRMRR